MRETIQSIEKKANYSIPISKNDYEVDGILHCYKCNTPKECIVTFYWGDRKERCLCKCYEKRGSAKLDEINALREMCLPLSHQHNITFAKDDSRNPQLTEIAKRFVSGFANISKSGKGLIFCGIDSGKTFTALCIANALVDEGKKPYWLYFPAIVKELTGIYTNKRIYFNEMNGYNLIIIDGFEPNNTDVAYPLIETLNRATLPFIITTSLTKEEFQCSSDIAFERTFGTLKDRYFLFECKRE